MAMAATTASAFQPRSTVPTFGVRVLSSSSALQQSTTTETEQETADRTKKEARLRMMKSKQFHRKGFKEVREKVEADMEQQFESSFVKDLRSSNYVIERDGVKVFLAKVCSERVCVTVDDRELSLKGTLQSLDFSLSQKTLY